MNRPTPTARNGALDRFDDCAGRCFLPPRRGDRVCLRDARAGHVHGTVVRVEDGTVIVLQWDHLPRGLYAYVDWVATDIVWSGFNGF